VVLIFDEVKTGLTIAAGGATERFGVEPDVVTLAKALGAGLPTGALGMTPALAALVEDGRVPQFGTFNGNPLGMAAARASLLEILTPDAYAHLERLGNRMAAGVSELLAARQISARVTSLGSKGSVSWADPVASELIWTFLVNRGLYTTPGREQEWNLSVTHGNAEVDRYLEVFGELASELTSRSCGSARA
jgi:glutamate-1-semialdehyde 2,1-aminomutase